VHALPRWLVVAACGLAVALTWQSPHAATEVGDVAPPLVAAKLDGSTFDLGTLRGKTVIVNFWATWCVPCRSEMPVFDTFYRHYHGQGLEMIAVSADRSRDRDDVIKVMQAFSYPAAMLKDAKVNGFGAPRILPVTYVVDSTGVVRAKLVPESESGVSEKVLADAVLPLLLAGASPVQAGAR
jgi:cytochrome c biogenesis protein CcmG, thiol:disulfide interchange protein DsbE